MDVMICTGSGFSLAELPLFYKTKKIRSLIRRVEAPLRFRTAYTVIICWKFIYCRQESPLNPCLLAMAQGEENGRWTLDGRRQCRV